MDVLLSCGADVTLENDSGDSVLDVAGDRLRRHILSELLGEGEWGLLMRDIMNLCYCVLLRVYQSRGSLHEQCQGSAEVCMAGGFRQAQEMSGKISQYLLFELQGHDSPAIHIVIPVVL